MLKRMTSWSFRHRRVVVASWLVILVAINLAAMTFGGENKQDFLSPGTDSKAAIELLDERFSAQAGDTVTIVIHDDAGAASPGVRAVAEPLVERVRRLPHVVAVVAPWDPAGGAQLSADGTTGYATVQLDSTSARFPVSSIRRSRPLRSPTGLTTSVRMHFSSELVARWSIHERSDGGRRTADG